MDRRSLLILVLAASVAPPIRSGSATNTAATHPPPSTLAGVPGLEKRVTYTETKIPLSELVAKVAADTGVPLRAAPDVADEPVAVVVKEFSARELLEQLADLLDYQWSRRAGESGRAGERASGRGSGSASERARERESERTVQPSGPTPKAQGPTPYLEIWQDLASRQREEALRRALYDAVERRFQAELAIDREVASLPQKEIERLWGEEVARVRQHRSLSMDERIALLNTPEERARWRRYNAAGQLWSPINRALALWMTQLPREQWAALREGGQLIFSSAPKRGELPLPASVLRTFRSSSAEDWPAEKPYFWEDPQSEEFVRRQSREKQTRWAGADAYQVTIRFTPDWPRLGWIVFNAISFPMRNGERVGQKGENPTYVLNITPEASQPRPKEDPGRRALLEQDPLLGARKPFQVSERPHPATAVTGTFYTLPEILPHLARVYGAQFIADAYWDAPRIDDLALTGAPVALFTLLDRWTWDSFTWDRRGDLVRLRNLHWFLLRSSEVPLRAVRHWAALCERLGAPPLEEYAALATALTDRQLQCLTDIIQTGVFPPGSEDLGRLSGARFLLRVYAGLLPDQRRVLLQGKRVPLAQIPARLRTQLTIAVNRAGRMSYPLMDMSAWNGGSLSLTSEPRIRVREERGGTITYRLETPAVDKQAPPEQPRTGAPLPAAAERVRRYPVRSVKLQFQWGTEAPVSAQVVVGGDAEEP